MKAIIMAGGEGTRLRPLTCDIPKPMVPIINKPVMEHIVNLLRYYDITNIGATLYYLPDSIKDYFEDGEELGVNIKYFIEEIPLGTGGSVLNAHEFLDDTFIVISGDALTNLDIKKALEFHQIKKSQATLVLKKQPIPLEYGIVITDEEGKITRFLEKPNWGEVFSDTVNTGIYILEPEVLNYYKPGENFDFSKDLFPKLLRDNIPMYGYVTEDYWCDIGDLNSYKQTNFDILKCKILDEINPSIHSSEINIGRGTIISNKAKLHPPVYIGENCVIRDNALIDSYSVIGDNCIIDENANVKQSMLWNNSSIGKNSHVSGSIISDKVKLLNNVNIYENSVIGSDCCISSGATVKPDIKIWPCKNIDEGSVVSKNLVWGTKHSKNIFGARGISGEINIDITPEFSSLLGSAFSSTIKKDGPIIVSSDNSNAANLIKQAIITGVISTGADVIELDNTILPVTRFAVRFYKASGAAFISRDTIMSNRLQIELLNHNGGNIDRKTEKKIEQVFLREDFERCSADMLRSSTLANNFSELYIQNSLKGFKNLDSIKKAGPKVLIASGSQRILELANSFLSRLGCKVYTDFSSIEYTAPYEYAEYISTKIKSSNLDLGFLYSENGENIIVVDDKGTVVSDDSYNVLYSLILLKSGCCRRLLVPLNKTMIIDSIAHKYNSEVVRTKTSIGDIMEEIFKQSSKDENYMEQYIFNFDGILASGRIIEYTVAENINLSSLVAEIPEFYLKKHAIPCTFSDRGRIIREFIEANKHGNIELIDGIKVNTDNGWTLILPDNERPVFNIYAEGMSEEYAEELLSSVNETVYKLLETEPSNG
jgi:mannose-1-phosphate guanylyltransferase/phosphomannomutase